MRYIEHAVRATVACVVIFVVAAVIVCGVYFGVFKVIQLALVASGVGVQP